MGYNYQEIQESLNENKFDEICATYMLLGLQKDQQILSNPSSSSLSPMGLEHTISLTPSSIPPLSPSTRGDVASGYGRPPPPSPTTKTSSAGTPSAVMQKKMSAPGVVSSSVSNRICNCHNGAYCYFCNYFVSHLYCKLAIVLHVQGLIPFNSNFDPHGLYCPWSKREIWPNLKANFISETGEATPNKIDVHAYSINLYLHEFFEPISFNSKF